MVTEFSLSNESESREWDDYVGGHPDGTPFHLTRWMRVIRETYSFEPLLYVHKGEDKRISGVCPFFIIKSLFTGTRIVSAPFSDYCGPITNGAQIEKEILDKVAREKGRTARYIEIRHSLLPGSGYVMHNIYAQPVLELNQLSEAVFKNFDKNTIQRSI
ncbi:MAG: hypothetical protein HZB83_04815, partial [Deltaproteobacteria bacterium]|nr:hypothetical protein [Deltaproteobacteria bacterium]